MNSLCVLICCPRCDIAAHLLQAVRQIADGMAWQALGNTFVFMTKMYVLRGNRLINQKRCYSEN